MYIQICRLRHNVIHIPSSAKRLRELVRQYSGALTCELACSRFEKRENGFGRRRHENDKRFQ